MSEARRVVWALSAITLAAALDTWGHDLKITPKAEPVTIVAYDKDDFKTSGDWVLLLDGRNIQVRSSLLADLVGWPVIRGLPEEITARDLWKLRGNREPLGGLSGVEARLDSINGLLCIGGECYKLMAVCPTTLDRKAGKKCRSFSE